MAVALQTGSVVTVVVAGQDLLNPFGAALSDRVSRALADQGARLIVRRFTENDRDITGPTTVLYRATVVAETTVERSGPQEVAAVVAFAFHLATGYEATEYGVSDVQQPGSGGITPTPDEPDSVPRIPLISDILEALTTLVRTTPYVALGIVIIALVAFFMFSQRITGIGKVRAR